MKCRHTAPAHTAAWGCAPSPTRRISTNRTSPYGRGKRSPENMAFIITRARYYSPATGRFLAEDPIRADFNWYVYCGNNPIMFVDPWGLAKQIFNITSYILNDELGNLESLVNLLTKQMEAWPCTQRHMFDQHRLVRSEHKGIESMRVRSPNEMKLAVQRVTQATDGESTHTTTSKMSFPPDCTHFARCSRFPSLRKSKVSR